MRTIPLTRGKHALVDNGDYQELLLHNWCAVPKKNKVRTTWYAVRGDGGRKNRRTVYMHRQLLGVQKHAIKVDHRDGDGLNNQRSNLRVCTHGQNCMNSVKRVSTSSRFKGVYLHACGKWMAYITAHGKYHYLGLHRTEKEARAARSKVLTQLHGEFAFQE